MLGERTFERVGGNQTITVDVRLVAATNRDLESMVAEKKFREDLFYRLNVVRITMPPLRDRREDIPLMVQTFLKRSCHENDKPLRDLTSDAMNRLLEYHWPGNVRELRAAVDHGVVLATGPKITLRDLPLAVRQRFVKLGQTKGDLVAVISGLKEGDEIVASGTFKLQNNAPVQINNKVLPGQETNPNPEES